MTTKRPKTDIALRLRFAIAFPALLIHQVLFGVLWVVKDVVEWLMDGVEKFGIKVHYWALPLQNESKKETK